MASLTVVSGPSGVGKTTLCKSVLELSNGMLARSISYTTRPIRPGEIQGKDYHFVSQEKFRLMIEAGEFVEYTKYLDNFYGTAKQELDKMIALDQDVILILDHVGAENLRILYPEHSGLIFCSPPSIEALKARLVGRKSSKLKDVKQRLKTAQDVISTKNLYDYVIINDSFSGALKEMCSLINKFSKKKIFPIESLALSAKT